MRFSKMHGLGNDFVMIDCLTMHHDEDDLQRKAVAICDRRFGVGADGLILILPSDGSDFRMRVINSDGSEAEMCGNGVRCLGKYVFDRGLTTSAELNVETGAGVKTLLLNSADGKVKTVKVDMGAPEFRRNAIPMSGPDAEIVRDEPISVSGANLSVTCVSMGNPHCVAFVDDVAAYPVASIGPQVERHELFPKRTNVEFVQIMGPSEIKMRVWERGAGETLACGTGACASAIASALNGKTGDKVLVHLAGGDLEIDWTGREHVYMTGPASDVFDGELNMADFS
jgi:diaminopimelate epimerase